MLLTRFTIILVSVLALRVQAQTHPVEAFLYQLAERSKEQVSNNPPEQFDFTRYLRMWAAKQGKTQSQAESEITQWISKVKASNDNTFQLGLAYFYLKDFTKAANFLSQYVDRKSRALQKLQQDKTGLTPQAKGWIAENARALRVLGHIFYVNYDFVNALKTYEQAVQYTSKDETPENWAVLVLDIAQTYSEVGRRSDRANADKIFANAITAFQRSLAILTREGQPLRWAEAENGMGTTLALRGIALPKEQGLPHLQDGVAALRRSLEVFTKAATPIRWAKTQNNLGSALAEIGARKGGEAGSRAILDAITAYKAALEVRTSDALPTDWANTQLNLAAAYTYLQDWQNVKACYVNVLKVEPENQLAYQSAVELSQKVVFDFPLALKLNQEWIKAHPNDLREKVKLVEKYFTTAQFTTCREAIREFKASKDYSVLVYVIMDIIDIATDIALQQRQRVPDKLQQLLATIKDQSESFQVSLNFNGLKYFVSNHEPLQPYRDWLLRYFAAFEGQSRDEIYVALKEVKDTLHLITKP